MTPATTDTMPLVMVKGFRISSDLFISGYAAGEGPCQCTSLCCEGGVYADLHERDRILEHRELIRKYMDETQSTDDRHWFEAEEHDDSDFPSGRCVGTAVIHEKCAFLDKIGRCSIQAATSEDGMGPWALKPLFCILYPIEVSEKTVTFDAMLQDEQPCCSVSPAFATPLFRACRDELVHLLGEDGYAELERQYASLAQTQTAKAGR